MPDHLTCPHCDRPVFRKANSGSRLKARVNILVLHKSGDLEVNCKACGKAIILPTMFRSDNPELRKGVFTVRKRLTSIQTA